MNFITLFQVNLQILICIYEYCLPNFENFNYNVLGISSLQRWAKNLDMRSGILHEVLHIMSISAHNLKPYEKLTVLMFDEVKVSSTLEYDNRHDQVLGPHNQMQVIMARGIASPWKQPVMIDFDKKMTKSILFDVIGKLDKIGYTVICCVSDCGGGNIGLWKELQINYEKPFFEIPNKRNIVYVPDSLHLLKLVRNWLLDTGFCLNEKQINKEPLEALIKFASSEVTVCHKLSKEHLTCDGPQRQKVKLATQLLSHTTASALKFYKPIADKKLNDDTADFIELINNWFDLSNVSYPNSQSKNIPFKAPYGTFINEQESLFSEVYETILTIRCNGKNKLQMFQKGILMYINGARHLLNILKEHGLNYLLTTKINQDALENFFSQLRTKGGLNDHPTPLNALYRIRMILLGKNPGISSKSNTHDDNKEEYLLSKVFKEVDITNVVDSEQNEITSETDTATECDSINTSYDHQEEDKNEMSLDAVEYLAGWVAKKYRYKYPELGSTSTEVNKTSKDHDYLIPSWLNYLSYGGLIIPSINFKQMILRVENLFKKFTKNKIPKTPNVVNRITRMIYNRMITDEKYKPVIKTCVKQRIFIRIKFLNQNMTSMCKIKRSKLKLQKLNKLRKIIT